MTGSTLSDSTLFIGLMSGTSLDGVDGVLAALDDNTTGSPVQILESHYMTFPDGLRADLAALQTPGDNEVHREAIAANQLGELYAKCVQHLLQQANISADKVRAIGCHGQTIRHCPQLGYTRQINQPALLAEMTGIDVIADFRSRDIAAGGQGAPLVPAFHQAVFAKEDAVRVVANIGGMSNISILDGRNNSVTGFDTGPGNVLMDAWCAQHRAQAYDIGGAWAASGTVLPDLLAVLLDEPFLKVQPPKSTGRDLFNTSWLATRLAVFGSAAPSDVQATLTMFTAQTLADMIARHAPRTEMLYVCGGGAYNLELLKRLREALAVHRLMPTLSSTEVLGIAPNHVEALAFAWLAKQFCLRRAGNIPAVTGARSGRILGALYLGH